MDGARLGKNLDVIIEWAGAELGRARVDQTCLVWARLESSARHGWNGLGWARIFYSIFLTTILKLVGRG